DVHFIDTSPTALAPMPLIELLSAAVAMNLARSSVTMVACPPARTHFDLASARIPTELPATRTAVVTANATQCSFPMRASSQECTDSLHRPATRLDKGRFADSAHTLPARNA